MAEKPRPRLQDTTLYRIEKNVGFNARVEPLWFTYSRMAGRLGFFLRWREKHRIGRLVRSVNRELRRMGAEPRSWDEGKGGCVCHHRVAKMGVVTELKHYLARTQDAAVARGWTHLMALPDRNGLLIPPDFDHPVTIGTGSEGAFIVASSARVQAELKAVNQALRIDETFAIRKMVDFLDATDRDIAMYESRFGTHEGFWAKFAYILLRHLTDASVERKLPLIIA